MMPSVASIALASKLTCILFGMKFTPLLSFLAVVSSTGVFANPSDSHVFYRRWGSGTFCPITPYTRRT